VKLPAPPRPVFAYGLLGGYVSGLTSDESDSRDWEGRVSAGGGLIDSEYELKIQSAQDSVVLDMVAPRVAEISG
jgi:hypothetical protein